MEQQAEIPLDVMQDRAEASLKKERPFSFEIELATLKEPEEKIAFSLQFMQRCLSREGPPSFKEFWEARKLCLTFFKQTLNPKSRSLLWEKYIGLTSEAYHLKELMDQESSFAREQIEGAIKALEDNIQNITTLLNQAESLDIPEECYPILSNRNQYQLSYQEFYLLHTFAERAHALRKEILKTEMRFRFKNKLLDALTNIGDHLFPRRKLLMENLCDAFLVDIEKYAKGAFDRELQSGSIFTLKDTIKALQYVAGQLYFNSEPFAKTKKLLGECWEKIQVKERERRAHLAKKKEISRQNDEESAKRNQEEKEQKRIDDEIESQRRALFLAYKLELQNLIEASLDLELLQKKYDQLDEEKSALILNEQELVEISSLLREIKQKIFDQKQQLLFSLEDPEILDKLDDLLGERKKMRQELKKELESLRKASFGSGMDFERAIYFKDLLENGKQLLDKIETSIVEIEEKIFDLEA